MEKEVCTNNHMWGVVMGLSSEWRLTLIVVNFFSPLGRYLEQHP